MNGSILKKAVISGANNLANQKNQIDELNVFPVPDGDTGANMSMTAIAAANAVSSLNEPTVGEVAKETASAMLRGARGNSGVILSLLFRGISNALKDAETLTASNLKAAFKEGVKSAYKAVMNPTEGTILTVARLASETIQKDKTQDVVLLFEKALEGAKDALAKTPDMLPALKKAGVVDAGGQGFVVMLEGMLQVLKGEEGVSLNSQPAPRQLVNAAAEFDGEITYTYCTEFIVNKHGRKSPVSLRAFLESIGDCVVVVDDDDIIKVHVHTDHPGNAIEEALKFGLLSNLKIDNMRLQRQERAHEAKESKKNSTYVAVDPDVPYGFVAVAAGQGVMELFENLGAEAVVSGGQTMNPSTDDLLSAIHSVGAKRVFVLPNNKNIIMAAEQAARLADRDVCVLQTRTIPEGISAMLAFDPEQSAQVNQTEMTHAFSKVKTGLITFAARDSYFDGKQIGKNEILALENGKISFTDKDVSKAAYRLMKRMVSSNSRFATVLYGNNVTDENAEILYETLKNKFGDDLEINLINGGQPVYYYIISVE